MKNLLEKLVPFFLKSIDRESLLRHRLLWITKVHYVLFYVGIALALSMAYINWYPASYDLPQAEMFALVGSFIMLIPLGFWVFKQISFSIEQNYGKRFVFLDQMRFGLYLVCTLAFLSIPFGTTWMMEYKVANFVDDSTFQEDKKLLNLYNPFFLTQYEINNQVSDIETNTRQLYLLDNGYTYDNYYDVIDSYDYPKAVIKKIETESNTLANFYNSSAMSQYSSYHKAEVRENSEMTKSYAEVFAPVWEAKSQHRDFIATYIRLFNKYGGNINLSADEIMNLRKNTGKSVINMEDFIAQFSSQKYDVQSNLGRISDEKYSWQRFLDHKYENASLVFFIAFFASLLLSIYNMVRLKDFIISAVAFVGLGIGTTMFAVLFNEIFGAIGQNSDSTILCAIFGVYVLALVQSLRIFTANHFSIFKTICLILTVFSTPFVIWWMGLIGESIGSDYTHHSGSYYIGQIWIGILVFSVLIEPIFRKLLLKMQSLPKA